MDDGLFVRWDPSSFHINHDLSPLIRMIKVMSLQLSEKARQRLAWMDSFRECGNASQVCRHFSIPLRTFWRWKARFDPFDLKSLEERSRRPRSHPQKTSLTIERKILALKQKHPRYGVEKIALLLRLHEAIRVSGKTCWKILKRHERIIRYHTRKRKPPKPRVDWASVRLPGDLVQVDTKHISLHGRKVYQYTAIDVVTRYRHATIRPRADMETTVGFLEELQALFPKTIAMVQTDNGSEFGKRVSSWCRLKHIRHVFSHAHRPQENAYVERSHRIDEEEFYSMTALGPTIQDLQKTFSSYLFMYNTERPHWGLGGRTPAEVLASYS